MCDLVKKAQNQSSMLFYAATSKPRPYENCFQCARLDPSILTSVPLNPILD
jgi:hypothetical protein